MSELTILTYFCNLCPHSDEDLIEISGLQYAPKIRIKKITCSDKIDPYLLVKALSSDADGILVTCCYPIDCQNVSDNYIAMYKVFFVKKLIEKVGINSNRIDYKWISASETERVRHIINNYTNLIAEIGPMTMDDKNLLQDELKILKDICTDSYVNWLFGKSRELVKFGNVYDEKISEEKFLGLIDKILDAEIIRKRIINLVSEKPLTTIDIAKKLSLSPDIAMKHLLALKTRQKIQLKMINQDAKFMIKGY